MSNTVFVAARRSGAGDHSPSHQGLAAVREHYGSAAGLDRATDVSRPWLEAAACSSAGFGEVFNELARCLYEQVGCGCTQHRLVAGDEGMDRLVAGQRYQVIVGCVGDDARGVDWIGDFGAEQSQCGGEPFRVGSGETRILGRASTLTSSAHSCGQVMSVTLPSVAA